MRSHVAIHIVPDSESETEESDDEEKEKYSSDDPSNWIFVSFARVLEIFECKKSDDQYEENPEDWEMEIAHIEVKHIFSEIREEKGSYKYSYEHKESQEPNLDIFFRYKISGRSWFHFFFLDLIEDFFFHSHNGKKLKNKMFFHVFFGPSDECTDRPDWDAEDIADLIIALVFHELKDEDFPVLFPYLWQSSLYHFSRLLSIEIHIGTEIAFDIVDEETVRFIIETDFFDSRIFAEVVDDVVVGDAVDPGWKREIFWDFEDIFVDLDENLLQQILRFSDRDIGRSHDIIEEFLLIPVDNIREIIRILSSLFDYLKVC